MAVQCSPLPQFAYKPFTTNHALPFSSPAFTSTQKTTSFKRSSSLHHSKPRLWNAVSALSSEEKVAESSSSGTEVFGLTYLEGNSWLWEVGGVRILVDPILVGNLDFGIPWLYDAAKKFLKNFQFSDLPELDCLMITQSLDDHCHLKTLKPLSQKLPNLRVIAAPSAKTKLEPLFSNAIMSGADLQSHCQSLLLQVMVRVHEEVISRGGGRSSIGRSSGCGGFEDDPNNWYRPRVSWMDSTRLMVTYLEPGQSSEIEASNGSRVKVQATAGPVLGPPWQSPENGYIVTSPQGELSLYYEPHCVYDKSSVEKQQADIVITPVIKQLLPSFTLVSGQEDAVQLAKLLRAKFIVPMRNGDLDAKGFLSSIIQSDGTLESFKVLLSKEIPDAKVLDPIPGVQLCISAP